MRMTPCKSTYFHVVHAHAPSDLDQVAARNAEYAQIVNTSFVLRLAQLSPARHRRVPRTAASSPGSRPLICAQVGRRDPRFAPVALGPCTLGRFWCSRRGRRRLAGRFELPLDGWGGAPPPPSPSFARRASVVAGAVVGGAAAVATGVGVAVVGVGAAVAGGAAVGAGATAGA